MKRTSLFAAIFIFSALLISGCLQKNPACPSEPSARPTIIEEPIINSSCEPGPVAFDRLNAVNGGCVIVQGFYSDTRENIVIRTQAEYDAFLAAHSHNLGAGIVAVEPLVIDFDKKILIAVFMGKFIQTCNSTSIESVTRSCIQLCGTPPVTPGPGMPFLTVRIKETNPGPADLCLQAVSWPASLVLIDKQENESAFIGFEYL
jgi:hypothetical protein